MTDRRRRQKDQRAAKRQAEKKQEARRELGRRLITAIGFGLVVVAIFAVGAVFGGDEGALPRGYEGYRNQPTACGAEQPEAEQVVQYPAPEPQTDVTSDSTVIATLVTSCGDIVIELDPGGYPMTVDSFVFLAREGYFDGQVFYRMVEDFRVFAGDPMADGTGGPGYRIPDELPPDDFVYTTGVVAMDNMGRGTTGSRFFIVLGEAAVTLNPQFNLLGEVGSGQETLDRIAAVETARNFPRESVYIERVSVEVTGS